MSEEMVMIDPPSVMTSAAYLNINRAPIKDTSRVGWMASQVSAAMGFPASAPALLIAICIGPACSDAD